MLTLLLLAAFQCPDGSPPPCAGTRAPANAVAVLYFDNQSRDTSDAYLATGLTEEITTRLGQHRRLIVSSRTTMQRYRPAARPDPATIARTLRVSWLVNGTVRRSGQRLRVGVELVRASDGVVAWTHTYDRTNPDLLAIEEDVAREVATAIAGRLLPDERAALSERPTRSAEAYDHFLRALYAFSQRSAGSLSRAISEFEMAARIDPRFSRAQSRIAHTWAIAAWRFERFRGLSHDSLSRLALRASERAVELAPLASDAWMARGVALIVRPESLAASQAALVRAIGLDTLNAEAYHAFGWSFWYGGRTADAMRAWRRAAAIEPDRPITLTILSYGEFFARNWSGAARWADSAIALDPGFGQARFNQFWARLEMADMAGARAAASAIGVLVGSLELAGAFAALIALREGDSTRLRDFVERPPAEFAGDSSLVTATTLASFAVEAGRPDIALTWLERPGRRNSMFYAALRYPPLDRLRGQPRYEALIADGRFAPLP